jgi:hypothetical protein
MYQRSNILIKNIRDKGIAKLMIRVGGQRWKSIKDLKIVSYTTNRDKIILNSSAKDSDAYLWNFLDK